MRRPLLIAGAAALLFGVPALWTWLRLSELPPWGLYAGTTVLCALTAVLGCAMIAMLGPHDREPGSAR